MSQPLIIALESPPPSGGPHILLSRRDNKLNTPLHHASAFGRLKTLRILVTAGADPFAKNSQRWSALDYSATVAAEVYVRGLMREMGQVRGEQSQLSVSNEGGLGVRVIQHVGDEENDYGRPSSDASDGGDPLIP